MGVYTERHSRPAGFNQQQTLPENLTPVRQLAELP